MVKILNKAVLGYVTNITNFGPMSLLPEQIYLLSTKKDHTVLLNNENFTLARNNRQVYEYEAKSFFIDRYEIDSLAMEYNEGEIDWDAVFTQAHFNTAGISALSLSGMVIGICLCMKKIARKRKQ